MNTDRKIEHDAQSTKHEEPLVSVCIGVYNRERYIRECLDSVLAQTYQHIEIVVADNASTDETVRIVQSYPRVKLVRRNCNSGFCSTTRNMAVRSSTGRYIAFLDSDDAWYSEKIEKQVRFLEAHPDIPLCHTYCDLIDEASTVYGRRHEGRLPPTGEYFPALMEHCWVTISSVMIRRELYDEVGPFTEALPYGVSGEDYEFFLKAARTHPFGLMDEPLVKYRKSPQGLTAGDWHNQPATILFYRELLRRRDVWEGLVTSSTVRRRFRSACCENATHWRGQGYPLRSLWAVGQALRVSPFSVQMWTEGMRSMGRLLLPRRGRPCA